MTTIKTRQINPYSIFEHIQVYLFIVFILLAHSNFAFGQSSAVSESESAEFNDETSDSNSVDAVVGFAATEWGGLSTTTGGQGGQCVVVTSGEQLNGILLDRKDSRFEKNNPPLIIIVEGTLIFTVDEMMDVKETYNLSILGAGTDAAIEGFGLNIYKSYNIIVRNIEFRNCPDDAVNICDPVTHHIWIDHCTFSDGNDVDPEGDRHDGLLDIKQGAGYVTVSWNHFYNHGKACLLGHSDKNGAEDKEGLKVTYHHNWFDNTHSRHPRVRFGECHIFNNYYDNSLDMMIYGIASTQEADVVVESNYFKNVPAPMYSGYGASDPGDIIESDNIYENSGSPQTRGEAFNPGIYYSYAPDNPADIPSLVITGAGVGKINIEIPAPID